MHQKSYKLGSRDSPTNLNKAFQKWLTWSSMCGGIVALINCLFVQLPTCIYPVLHWLHNWICSQCYVLQDQSYQWCLHWVKRLLVLRWTYTNGKCKTCEDQLPKRMFCSILLFHIYCVVCKCVIIYTVVWVVYLLCGVQCLLCAELKIVCYIV